MKTLLKIAKSDGGGIFVEMAQDEESVARIGLVFDKLSRDHIMFRALICATFEEICRTTPDALDKLHDNLNKEEQPSQAAIHITPNPTKS